MRQLAIIGLVACVFAFPLSARSAPVRVVVYRFAIDQHGFTSAHTTGFTNSGTHKFSEYGHGYSNYTTTTSTLGASGTITVNVVATPPDGGLVVDAIEFVDRADRAQQAIRCAIYANPENVVCDQNLEQVGDVPNEVKALLMYLGRGFYDKSYLDANKHWQTARLLNNGMASVTTDYTVEQTVGDVITLSLNRVLRDGPDHATTTGTIQYDPTMTLPVKAHLVTNGDAGGLHGSIIDYQLQSDSFTQHAAISH